MKHGIAWGCLVAFCLIAAVLLSTYVYVRPELIEFNQIVEADASAQYPPMVHGAVLATEDPIFLQRSRFDGLQMMSMIVYSEVRNLLPGADVIVDISPSLTDSMIRSYLPSDRPRPLTKRILLRTFIDATVPRQSLLRSYVNRVYLGQRGERSIFGFRDGASAYFGVEVERLTVVQTASLAATIRRPSGFAPPVSSEAAVRRRLRVVDEMHRFGVITDTERTQAQLALRSGTPNSL